MAIGFERVDYGGGIVDPYDTKQQVVRAQEQFHTNNRTSLESAAYFLPSTFLAMVDTFGESLGILDDNEMEEWLNRVAPDMGAYFSDNRSVVGFAGDVAGSFIPATFAIKAVRAGSVFGRVAEKAFGKGARFITSTGKTNDQLFQEVYQRARVVVGKQGGLDLTQDTVLKGMRNRAIARSVGDTLVEGVAADAAVALTMHQSEFLFPPEASLMEHLAFFGGFNAAFGAAGFAIAKASMNRGIQNAVGGLAEQVGNPSGLPLNNLTTDVLGERWQAATVYATSIEELQGQLATARSQGQEELASNTNEALNATTSALSDVFRKMFMDSPVDGVTRSQSLATTAGELGTLQAAVRKDPQSMIGMTALESVQDRALDTVETSIQRKKRSVAANIEATSHDLQQLAKGGKRGGPEFRKAQNKLAKLEEEAAELERMVGLVFETDGNLAGLSNREGIYQDGVRKVSLFSTEPGLPANIAEVDVAGTKLRVSVTPDGIRTELPSSMVTTRLDVGESFQLPELQSDYILSSIAPGRPKAHTLQTLSAELRSVGDLNLEISPILQELRDSLPAQFTGYLQKKGTTQISLQQTDKFSIPVTVTREQIWASTPNGTLIHNPQARARVTGAQFTSMSQVQRTAVWDAGHKLADQLAIKPDLLPTGKIDGMHHTELDVIIDAHRKAGDMLLRPLVDAPSIDDVIYRSLASKFEDFQRMRQVAEEAFERGEIHPNWALDNVSRALNLPLDNHPIVQFFESARLPDQIVQLRDIVDNMDELKQALAQSVESVPVSTSPAGALGQPIPAIPENLVDSRGLIGTMMRHHWDNKPVIGFVRNTENTSGVGRDELMQAVGKIRSELVERLAGAAHSATKPNGSLIASGILAQLQAVPEALSQAKKGIMQMVQGNQLTGDVMSQLVQQRFRLREMPGALELDTLADMSERHVDSTLKRLLKGEVDGVNHQQRFNKLMEASNTGDQTLFFNAQNALRKGWQLEAEPRMVKGPNGETLYQLQLASNADNQRLWYQTFGDEMPELSELGNTSMPMPDSLTGKAITMTQTAFEAIESMSMLSGRYLNEINALRKARGQTPIAAKRWHVPPKNLEKRHRIYLLDANGKVATVVGGDTAAEARRLAQQEREVAMKEQGRYLELASEDSMSRWHTSRGEAFFDMTDFSNPSMQTGPTKGRTSLAVIESGPRAFQDSLETLLKHFHDVGRETRGLLFEPELLALKQRRAASGIPTAQETIWDQTSGRILGATARRADSVVGRSLTTIETAYDKIMQHIWDKTQGLSPNRMGTRTREFEALDKRLGPEFNPFNDANDILERVHNVRIAPELRKHAALLNETTAALTLRMFDIGMMAINYASLASTMPPVIKMLQRLPTENEEQWRRRIGAFGTVTPDGIAQYSAIKSIVDGVHFAWSKEGRAVADRARQAGLFDQFAAEQIELFGMTGQSAIAGKLRRWSDAVSKLTDVSERQARAISWMTFYNIGRKGLGLEDRAAMVFAHQNANQVIADFRPTNRPVIFQGAAGMPLGLFTTYMWNYFQRMYGMLENKAWRGLGVQVGLQTSLFGAQSLPGWEQYTNYFMTNYDGSTSIVDRLNQSIGPEAADVFLNGSISSLTGVNVSSRAATSLPGQLTDPGFDSIPGLRLAFRGVNAVNQMYDSIKEQRGIDPQRFGEILAASNISKGVSNAVELMQGYSLDLRGNVIEEDTRTRLGVASRMLGFKPLYADKLRAENRRNRTTDRVQNELKARLGSELQSLARQGELDGEAVDDALASYMRAGGSPENFKRYFGQQLVRGTQSKLSREIADAVRRSNDENRVARLLFLWGQTPRMPTSAEMLP